jgi:quercetin dioxygenase-like cupin family protein
VKPALALIASALILAIPFATEAQSRSNPLLDNATVRVVRERVAAGEHRSIRAAAMPLIVVEPGHDPTYLARDAERVITNDSREPIDVLTVTVKPTRAAAPAAPPTEAPPGISRTTLIDNADVRVVRVRFEPGSREPVHTHPNDLLTVQLTEGRYDIMLGTKTTGGSHAAGSAQFLPRDIPHAYISTDAKPFELLSISIK